MGRRCRGDSGEVLVGGMTKLVVSLTAVAVLGFDTVSLVVAQFTAADDAADAARTAALAYRDSRNPQLAYETALAEVADDGGRIDPASFVLASDGTITLTLRTEATTLVAHRIARLDGWRSPATTASAPPPV